MERWIQIEGFPNYEISSDGRVRNVRLGRPVAVFLGNTGYYMVNLWKNGKHYFRQMHRLLVAAFIGSPEGMTVNHKNGIRSDNSLSNLEIVTQAENNHHKLHVLKKGWGNDVGKLESHQVCNIREMIAVGVMQKDIAAKYGVCRETIRRIRSGQHWGHHS